MKDRYRMYTILLQIAIIYHIIIIIIYYLRLFFLSFLLFSPILATPVQLLDRLLLTYIMLSHGRVKDEHVHQTLITIYSRTTPSVSVLCELCKLVPGVMVQVLAEVVKS